MKKFSVFAFKFTVLSIILAFSALFCNHYFINYVLISSEEASDIQEEPAVQGKVIVIDAGHGGMDGGTSSSEGVLEKDLNLDISKALSSLLKLCGYDTVLTRDGDYMLTGNSSAKKKMQDLRGRLDIAQSYEDCILVSIHMNYFPQESCRGLQIYYSPNRTESKDIAERVMTDVRQYLQPDNERQTKSADSSIFLLKRIQRPAILIECGFLSNYEEASLLNTDGYRDKLCAVFCSSLSDLLCESESLQEGTA